MESRFYAVIINKNKDHIISSKINTFSISDNYVEDKGYRQQDLSVTIVGIEGYHLNEQDLYLFLYRATKDNDPIVWFSGTIDSVVESDGGYTLVGQNKY